MSAPLNDERREIIPRWRELRSTIAVGELSPPTTEAVELPADFLQDKLDDWNREGTLPFATEVVGAALVLGRSAEAKEAALFVSKHRSEATPASIGLAEQVLAPPTLRVDTRSPDRKTLRQAIQFTRTLTRKYPRDAFAWVELARNYAMLGLVDKAAEAMEVALALGPNNRYILRSAARLYAHQGDRERAHDILRYSEATPSDPWLLAAELSTGSLAGRTPKFAKTARKLLEAQTFSPFNTGELASALATLDARSADLRRARKYFRLSLERPNENVVAQARWAATQQFIDLDPAVLRTPGTFEARAWYDFYSGEWSDALNAGKSWQRVEPFSARPAIHSSYIAAVALEDHNEALGIIDVGLLANPNDPSLLNNRAYSLANLGRLDEAEAALSEITRLPSDRIAPMKPVLLATTGLLAYRSGDRARGQELYRAAVEAAQQAGNVKLAAKAALFFALEDIRAGLQDRQVMNQALDLSSGFSTTDFELLRRRIGTETEASRGQSPESNKPRTKPH